MTAAKFTQEYFREQGAKGGKKGGKARLVKLTPERRSEIAKIAVQARERKRAERNGKKGKAK